MKIFVRFQKVLSFAISRVPSSGSVSDAKSSGVRFGILNLVPWFSLGSGILQSAIFILFEAETFREYSECMYPLVTTMVNFGNVSVLVWKAVDIFKLIDRFESTFESRSENPVSKAIYEKTNNLMEKWAKIIHYAFLYVSLPCMTLPYLIYSFVMYFTTDMNENAFFLPFLASMPVDWRTPSGYLVSFAIEFLATYYVVISCTCNVCFPVGACCFLIAFADDIKDELHDLNEYNQTKDHRTKEFYSKFCHLIEFHSIAKQFAPNFTDTFKMVYIFYFLWTLLSICDTLLIFQMELNQEHPSVMELLRLLFVTFWSFVQIFVFCDSSERVDLKFDEIDFYQCDWHSFASNIQRSLPIVIANTQLPVVLEAFGGLACTREAFQRVANGGFSYFMILRQFVN